VSHRPTIALLPLLALLVACSSPPSQSDVVPGDTPEAIAERFLEARGDRDESEVWSCFVGTPDRKRIYRSAADPHEHRTWEEFVTDFDFGWANPSLAPAEVWEKVAERDEGPIRILIYTQGTEEEPVRGRIEIAALGVGRGWLIAWVGPTR
jgi:hypothetical protein